MLPAQGDLNANHIARVRRDLAHYCDEGGKKLDQVAGEMRCNVRTLLKFAQDDYDPIMDDFARRLDRFLKSQEQDDEAIKPRQMVMTNVVNRIHSVIKQAHKLQSIAIVIGPGGTSKSLALQAAADYLIPNAVYLEFSEAEKSPSTVIRRISEALDVTSRYRMAESFDRIVRALKREPRMLLLDQADYLTFKGLNVIRDIHKRTGCPVVLCGTEDLMDTLAEDNPLRSQFVRLISNVYNINDDSAANGRPLYTVDEVIAYATEMKIRLTTDGADEATNFVNALGWGGLGKLMYLLLGAHVIARLEQQQAKKTGRVSVNRNHLFWAHEDMEDIRGRARVEDRKQVPMRKVKTA